MHDLEKTIIPLDDAHDILSVFGIGPQSRGYQRWRREDGFRQIDLEDVINESSSVLCVDWRGWLQEALDIIAEQLSNLEIIVESDLGADGNQGTLRIDGKSARVKYVSNDDDNFDTVEGYDNELDPPWAN